MSPEWSPSLLPNASAIMLQPVRDAEACSSLKKRTHAAGTRWSTRAKRIVGNLSVSHGTCPDPSEMRIPAFLAMTLSPFVRTSLKFCKYFLLIAFFSGIPQRSSLTLCAVDHEPPLTVDVRNMRCALLDGHFAASSCTGRCGCAPSAGARSKSTAASAIHALR